ncbi:MAG: hypothetical protein RLZZ422_2431 [Pseudomonadota bacterium]|jgi:hypothetical protein
MIKLFKPIVAAGLMGAGLLSTQAHATYATFVTSSEGCSSPCMVQPAKYSRVVTTTVITSTVVSRPRATKVAMGGSTYCPPAKRYRHISGGHQPRDGRAYYREPSFIW